MKTICKLNFILIIAAILATAVQAQHTSNYNYEAQKKYIPKELGKVYLGMPFKGFANSFDLSASEVGDVRFGYLPVTFPYKKGNIVEIMFKVHGLSEQEIQSLLISDTVTENTDSNGDPIGPWERKLNRIDTTKIPEKGIVYELGISFTPEFDQKTFVIKTFGKKGDVRQPDDDYHFYDIQWTPKTADGLTWLVRSFHENSNRRLRLIGLISGTEWDN